MSVRPNWLIVLYSSSIPLLIFSIDYCKRSAEVLVK